LLRKALILKEKTKESTEITEGSKDAHVAANHDF